MGQQKAEPDSGMAQGQVQWPGCGGKTHGIIKILTSLGFDHFFNNVFL